MTAPPSGTPRKAGDQVRAFPMGSTRSFPTTACQRWPDGTEPLLPSPQRRSVRRDERSHDENWSGRMRGQICGRRTQQQVVERAVTIASDHHYVRADLNRDLDDLFACTSRPDYEVPSGTRATEDPNRQLPDLRFLLIQ